MRQIKDSKKNFIYLTGAGGYASLLNEEMAIKNKGIAGGEIGVGYRLYYYHFLFSVGVEGRYSYYKVAPIDDKLNFRMSDSEGEPFTMNAIISNRQDVMHIADVQVPLQIGGEWGHWYGLIGAKLAFNVFGSARTVANVTTTATYDRFSEDFEQMPNHYLFEGQDVVSGKQPISFNPQLYGTFEVGYRIGKLYSGTGADVPYSKRRYYVGIFGELGFLNMHKENAQGDPVVSSVNPNAGIDFSVNPVYNSTAYSSAIVKNYMVGVKFTVLFELPKEAKCIICEERERRNRHRR